MVAVIQDLSMDKMNILHLNKYLLDFSNALRFEKRFSALLRLFKGKPRAQLLFPI
jgi:hypothetical protein